MIFLFSLQTQRLNEVKREEFELLEAQSIPLRNYLMKHVMPTLTQGLIECCKTRPEDAIDYLVSTKFGITAQLLIHMGCDAKKLVFSEISLVASFDILSNKPITNVLIRLRLCLCCSQTPKDRFFHVAAHMCQVLSEKKKFRNVCGSPNE